MAAPVKTCEQCGEPFARPPRYSQRQWDARRFCSLQCAAAAQAAVEDDFWAQIEKTETCWLWTGQLTRKGYGSCGSGRGARQAHRFSWVLHHGQPKNQVLHRPECPNKNCVRPDHLYDGTPEQNMRDRMLSDHPGPQHKLLWADVCRLREMFAQGWTTTVLAEEFGITRGHARAIATGRVWRIDEAA